MIRFFAPKKPTSMFPLIQLPRKSEAELQGDVPVVTCKVSINSTSEEVRRKANSALWLTVIAVSINSTSEEVRRLHICNKSRRLRIVSINSTSEEVRSLIGDKISKQPNYSFH